MVAEAQIDDADRSSASPWFSPVWPVNSGGTSGTPTYLTRDPSGNLIGRRRGTNYYYQTDNQQSVVTRPGGSTKNSYTYDPTDNPPW
jgi:hypothetical protein